MRAAKLLKVSYLQFVSQRRPDLAHELHVARPVQLERLAGVTQAKCAVRATPNSICILIVLSVVFPKTDWAEFKTSPSVQRLVSTARASERLCRLPRLRDVFERAHNSSTKSQRPMTPLSKLLQKSHIALEKQL